MDRTTGYYDLIDAFAEEGCPVCRLGLAAVDRSIRAIDYESVGDPGIREHLRASLGFCNVHAHQWLSQAHVLGTASIYVDVLMRLTAELRALPFRPHPMLADVAALLGPRARQSGDRRPLVPTRECLVCRVLADTEAILVRTLLATLPEPAFQDAYSDSSGLCLPHLRRAVGQAGDEVTFAMLRDATLVREERLLAELREIIRKHDYRFASEPAGAERGAAGRAVHHIAGAPGIPA